MVIGRLRSDDIYNQVMCYDSQVLTQYSCHYRSRLIPILLIAALHCPHKQPCCTSFCSSLQTLYTLNKLKWEKLLTSISLTTGYAYCVCVGVTWIVTMDHLDKSHNPILNLIDHLICGSYHYKLYDQYGQPYKDKAWSIHFPSKRRQPLIVEFYPKNVCYVKVSFILETSSIWCRLCNIPISIITEVLILSQYTEPWYWFYCSGQCSKIQGCDHYSINSRSLTSTKR